jgi:hypothetical protein
VERHPRRAAYERAIPFAHPVQEFVARVNLFDM